MSTQTGLPAVVSILQLGSGTLSSAAIVPASMTVAGVATTLGFPVSAFMTTTFGALPTGGGTGQILNKTSATDFSTQWSSVTQFVSVGTGLATSGSATSLVMALNATAGTGIAISGATSVNVALASAVGLSVLGVASTATAIPAPIVASASSQVLSVNAGGTGLLWTTVAGGTPPFNTTSLTQFGIVYGNGTSLVGVTAAGTTGWPLLGNGTSLAAAFGQINLSTGAGFTGVLQAANITAANLASSGLTGGVQGVLAVGNGGVGTSTLTNHGVLVGAGATKVTILAAANTGTILTGQGPNNDPSFGNLSSLIAAGTNITTSGSTTVTVGTISNPTFTTSVGIGTSAVINAGELLQLNANATTLPAANLTGALLHLGNIDSGATRILMDAFATNNSIDWRRANGTAGGRSAIVAGNYAGVFNFQGFDGSIYAGASFFGGKFTENWNGTSRGTQIEFWPNANGTTNAALGLVVGPGQGAVNVDPSRAIPTGGVASAGLMFGNATAPSFGIFYGTGTPTLVAGTGSIYLRNDGATATSRMYVNTNGSTTWTAFNTVA